MATTPGADEPTQSGSKGADQKITKYGVANHVTIYYSSHYAERGRQYATLGLGLNAIGPADPQVAIVREPSRFTSEHGLKTGVAYMKKGNKYRRYKKVDLSLSDDELFAQYLAEKALPNKPPRRKSIVIMIEAQGTGGY